MFEFLKSGGPVMIAIAVASVVGFAAFMERLWALRGGRVVPRGLRVELVELARQGRWADAITLCRKNDSPLSRVLEVVLAARGQPRGTIKELAEEVGRRETAELERYSGVVGIVASVAPLLGLLGTVWGMIQTFDVIKSQGMGQIGQLAGGISAALVTTFSGLSVGIPALIAHRYVLSRVDDLVLDLEEATLEVLELVKADGGSESA
ncbi:MAG: MotA/TolQ/ExbB proton channel family protein [Alphaproteobacteria bacterium]|nr:MotA/TolQ/ExbB proton channel family protein [Alphaproteobacteria bacterium]